MIKKYTLILLAALAALSCTRELVEPESAAYGTVEVDFSVSVPGGSSSSTKAFADKPDINSLYVAMFDASGYLVQYTQAECTDGYPYENDDKATTDTVECAKKYKVTLYVTNSALKVIHFIANGPSSVKYGSEEEVIASMIAYKTPVPAEGQIGPDVYWQRIELPKGVTYNSDADLTLISESANLLKSVGLIRNFAKFTISNSTSNFELTGAKILMTPDCGYVAPYNKKAGAFVTNYADLDVDELANAGYTGSAPATAKVETDFTDSGVLSVVDGKISTFTYEREKPTSAPACILVKGKYNSSDTETWYKVNLTDAETGDYYAIMRNFNYTVNITKVSGVGKSTQEAAYNSVGSGDISTTFEYKEITAMSNGSSKLEVQYTSKLVVSSTPFTLKYKFAPDMTDTYATGADHAGEAKIVNDYQISSDDTVIPLTTWNESGVQIYLDEAGATGAAISSISVADADNTDDLSRTITVTPTAVSGTTKTQDIVLVGRYKASDGAGGYTLKPITRVVTIMVHEKYHLTATCTPSAGVARTIGTPFTLSFTLPSGLPKACFPLQFNIEAEELSVSPVDGDLTICQGNSTIEGSTRRSSFYYVKTVNWSDYYNSSSDTYTLTHSANFKTNTESSATRIYLSNEYFNQTYTSFENPGPKTLIQPSVWYTGSSETGGTYPIVGATTTLYANVCFGSTEGRSVTFNIDGIDYPGTRVSENYGECVYKYDFTISSATYNAATGDRIPVYVTAKDDSWTSEKTSFGDIIVYSYSRTIGTTAISSLSDLKSASWFILKNSSYYLKEDTSSLTTENSNSNQTACFFKTNSDGNALITYSGQYVIINQDSVALSETNTAMTIDYNSGFRFYRKISSFGPSKTYYLTRSSLSITTTTSSTTWTAYPVTITCSAPE